MLSQELTWVKRLDMLRDIAAGMVFLHSRRPAVIHGDLRSPNLLLDLTFDGARYGAAQDYTAEIAWGVGLCVAVNKIRLSRM